MDCADMSKMPDDVLLRILAYAPCDDYSDMNLIKDYTTTAISLLVLKKTFKSWSDLIINNESDFQKLQ